MAQQYPAPVPAAQHVANQGAVDPEEWGDQHAGKLIDIGYGLVSGRTLTHITRRRQQGPGAVNFTVLCHGMRGWIIFAGRLAMDATPEMGRQHQREFIADYTGDSAAPRLQVVNCPGCLKSYEHRTKAGVR